MELLDLIFKIICDKNIVLGGCKWFLATTPIPIPKFHYRFWESE